MISTPQLNPILALQPPNLPFFSLTNLATLEGRSNMALSTRGKAPTRVILS